MNNGYRYLKTSILFLSGLGLAAALAGCGSSSSGGGSSGVDADENLSIGGKVLGSLVSGAEVCIDQNENGRCDGTDGFRVFSTTDGSYSIGEVPASLFEFPIVVEVPRGAEIVDPVSGATSPVATGYRLGYPPSNAENRFVSSLSTLVSGEFGRLGDLGAATAAVAARLEGAGVALGSAGLLGDYVAAATAAAASADDIKLYNIARIAGSAMRQSQEDTENDTSLDARVLMDLVAQRVFDKIDVIEGIVRNNRTLINEAGARSIVADFDRLEISPDDVENARLLAGVPFDLGPVARAKVWNFREGDDAAPWVRRTSVNFRIPGGPSKMSLDDYRAQIPESYEIGLLDGAGNLIATQRFDEPLWDAEDEAADPLYWYAFEENNTQFLLFTQSRSVDAPPGDYDFVLCPQGCDGNGQRIALGGQTVEPLDENLGIGNVGMLDTLLAEDLNLRTSGHGAFTVGDEQLVYLSAPPPTHGTSYRFYIGVDEDRQQDDDGNLFPESNRGRSMAESLGRLWIPAGWINHDTHGTLVRVEHRNTTDYDAMSWAARTHWRPAEIDEVSGLMVGWLSDTYQATYREDGNFSEGTRIWLNIFSADNNPLTEFALLDGERNLLVDLCLPNDLPTNQQAVAVYEKIHESDGSNRYFPGCENVDIDEAFGLNDPVYSYLEFWPRTAEQFDAKVLEFGIGLDQLDSDQMWGEADNEMNHVRYIRLRFQDGHESLYPTDLPHPGHDSLRPHGQPALSVCSIDADSVQFSWTPPDWMMAEYNAGELAVELHLRARDEAGNTLSRHKQRTQNGAAATVVSKAFLGAMGDGGELARFDVDAEFRDGNFFGPWRHRTYKTDIRVDMTADEVLNAEACN